MKLKQSLLLILSVAMMLLSANSYAGRQGINFFYGLGLGAISPSDKDLFGPDIAGDAAPTGSVVFGFIEDGWSLEGVLFSSLEAGTDLPILDYSLKGSDIGIAFRTIEKNGSYYKIKVSETDLDVTLTNNQTNISATVPTTGRTYTVGMGWRTSRENRMELDYSFHSNDDFSDPVHLITLSYLWGGAPYLGKAF